MGVERRRKVVMAIARIGDRSLGPALVEHLRLSWRNSIVRETLLDALRALGDGRIVEELMPRIRDLNILAELRCRMIETATALAEASHLETLLTLAEDPDLKVSLRMAIVNGLTEAGFRELSPWLMDLLREAPRHCLRARVSARIHRSGGSLQPWLERLSRRLGLASAEQEELVRLLLRRQAIIAPGQGKQERAVPFSLCILQNFQTYPPCGPRCRTPWPPSGTPKRSHGCWRSCRTAMSIPRSTSGSPWPWAPCARPPPSPPGAAARSHRRSLSPGLGGPGHRVDPQSLRGPRAGPSAACGERPGDRSPGHHRRSGDASGAVGRCVR